MKQKKVMIIGAGNRVQHVIIPALCRVANVEIDSIYSRSKKIIHIPEHKNILTQTNIETCNVSDVSYIVLSITPQQVPIVLKQLSSLDTSRATLLIETPVLMAKDVRYLPLLRNFQDVWVLEDYISMLSVITIKDMLACGIVGKIKYVNFSHSGFKYHALALFRLLAVSNSIFIARKIARSPECHEIHMSSGGTQATILEPRDYEVGRTLIVGTKGVIADYPLRGANVTTVSVIENNHRFSGICIKQNGKKPYRIKALLDSKQYNVTRMEALKIEALIRMFTHMFSGKPHYQYGYIDGMYNTIASYCLDKFNFFFDIPVPLLGSSIVRIALVAYAHSGKILRKYVT